MNWEGIVRTLLKIKHMPMAELARRVGYKQSTGVQKRLNGGGISVDLLVKWLSEMDCELIIRDLETRGEWKCGISMPESVQENKSLEDN